MKNKIEMQKLKNEKQKIQGKAEWKKELEKKDSKQAGAELGQAQLKLGLGFTSTIDTK